MALFGFGKKQENAAPAVNLSGIERLEVLGSGCKNCHTLYENAMQAAKELGLSVEVSYITDMQQIAAYGVMSMPALAVNGQVVSMGRVLKAADVKKLLERMGRVDGK